MGELVSCGDLGVISQHIQKLMIESLRHRSGLRVLASMPFTTRLLFPTVSARECSKYWAKDAS
eukprot:342701-Prorocentrum_lima.AAC.1